MRESKSSEGGTVGLPTVRFQSTKTTQKQRSIRKSLTAETGRPNPAGVPLSAGPTVRFQFTRTAIKRKSLTAETGNPNQVRVALLACQQCGFSSQKQHKHNERQQHKPTSTREKRHATKTTYTSRQDSKPTVNPTTSVLPFPDHDQRQPISFHRVYCPETSETPCDSPQPWHSQSLPRPPGRSSTGPLSYNS